MWRADNCTAECQEADRMWWTGAPTLWKCEDLKRARKAPLIFPPGCSVTSAGVGVGSPICHQISRFVSSPLCCSSGVAALLIGSSIYNSWEETDASMMACIIGDSSRRAEVLLHVFSENILWKTHSWQRTGFSRSENLVEWKHQEATQEGDLGNTSDLFSFWAIPDKQKVCGERQRAHTRLHQGEIIEQMTG